MRRSLIVYALVLPLVFASVVRASAAMNHLGSPSPWSTSDVATNEISDDCNGVSLDNLFTAAPRFDSIPCGSRAIAGLAHGTDGNREFPRPPIFILKQAFQI